MLKDKKQPDNTRKEVLPPERDGNQTNTNDESKSQRGAARKPQPGYIPPTGQRK